MFRMIVFILFLITLKFSLSTGTVNRKKPVSRFVLSTVTLHSLRTVS